MEYNYIELYSIKIKKSIKNMDEEFFNKMSIEELNELKNQLMRYKTKPNTIFGIIDYLIKREAELKTQLLYSKK